MEICTLLEQSRLAFRESLNGVSEEEARLSPGPGEWSVFEIVEHVAVSEAGMFSAFENATRSETSLENKECEAGIAARLGNTEMRGEAPERARPTGRFGSLAEALDPFDAGRQQTIRYAKEHQADLYSCSVRHPLFGVVNGYELLLIMAAHARRHAGQILRTR